MQLCNETQLDPTDPSAPNSTYFPPPARVLPVEAVHHLQLSSEVLLGEVVEHAGVHQRLHEVGAVLWQTQAGQPLITNPLMVHVSVRQRLCAEKKAA